jgi:hypothetical protein
MELESQNIMSKEGGDKTSGDPNLYKQRAIFYISVSGLILAGLLIDTKVRINLIISSILDIII